jgi:hypothetical protein
VNAASYQLSIAATAIPEVPLTNNDAGPSVQVVLRSNDGTASVPASGGSTQIPATQSLVVDSNGEIIAAINALPAVASTPLGRPRHESAGDGELAWLDGSPGGSALPAGFSLRSPQSPAAPVSVGSVSGSFLDALPDELAAGTHALGASSSVIPELAGLLRNQLDGSTPHTQSSEPRELLTAEQSLLAAEATGETHDYAPAAVSAKTVTLGMAVALGVASAATVPQRRRSSNWLQRAIEAIGLDA